MHEFKHPKYYKELRKLRNKSDQAISDAEETAASERATGPGHKQRDSQVVNQVKLSSQSQASSSKLQDLRTTEKFHGTRTEVLNADESIVRMLHEKGNLMWTEAYLVTLRNFKFYCEKVARSIIGQ